MFLHRSVSRSVRGGCLRHCVLGCTPPGWTPPKACVKICLEFVSVSVSVSISG